MISPVHGMCGVEKHTSRAWSWCTLEVDEGDTGHRLREIVSGIELSAGELPTFSNHQVKTEEDQRVRLGDPLSICGAAHAEVRRAS